MFLEPTINVALFKFQREGNPNHNNGTKMDVSMT